MAQKYGVDSRFQPLKMVVEMDIEQKKKEYERFRLFPEWIFKYHVWESLTGNQAKLLGALINRAHFVTKIGNMRNEQMAEESGISKSNIWKEIKQLEFFGCIKTRRKGWVRYFEIMRVPPDDIVDKVFRFNYSKTPQDTQRRKKRILPSRCKGRFVGKNSRKNYGDMTVKNTDKFTVKNTV